MGSAALALYLLLGAAIAFLSRQSLAQDITRTQQEILLEQGIAAPWVVVALVYYALGLLGWPFFVVVTKARR